MKKFLLIFLVFPFFSCAELQQIADQLPQNGDGQISNVDISKGLKQALNQGVEKQVSKLTEENGFFKNELVRIGLPPELQKVDKTLRDVGLSPLADEGLKILNRAAEDAVKEATPIFINAISQMSFSDARTILLGDNTAATTYLTQKTNNELSSRFEPVIKNSLDKVGATQVWAKLIQRYNNIPLTAKVNPVLSDYVTQQALNGVFTMIALEEQQIRNNIADRGTLLLRKVFALQD